MGKIHGKSAPKMVKSIGHHPKMVIFLEFFEDVLFYVRWHGMSFSDGSPQEFSRGTLFGQNLDSHIS